MNVGPASAATPEPVAGALLILIADDNPLMQELVSTILKGAGYETELAENGQIALAKLEKADFDLIVMDNHMPVMTGVEAIKVIRSREDGKRFIPILSLTADVNWRIEGNMCVGRSQRAYGEAVQGEPPSSRRHDAGSLWARHAPKRGGMTF